MKKINADSITFVMYKICGGVKTDTMNFSAMSDIHAIRVAEDFHNRCGLIGRYYCETSTGGTFSVS